MIQAPAIPSERICFLDTNQFRTIDTVMVQNYHVSIAQLMECAGLATAEIARSFVIETNPNLYPKSNPKLSVLVGKGNNGGDGLVAASHLHNWGLDVSVFLCHSIRQHNPICIQHIQRLKAFGVRVKQLKDPKHILRDKFITASDLIIDGLLGFGLKGTPKAPYNTIIPQLNSLKTPILSIDTPSGLNATTGDIEICIKADTTVSFAAPKKGFLIETVQDNVGQLLIADIGVPLTLFKQLKIKHYPKFYSGKFIEVFL